MVSESAVEQRLAAHIVPVHEPAAAEPVRKPDSEAAAEPDSAAVDKYNSVLTSMTPQSGTVGDEYTPVFINHTETTYTVKPISGNSGLARSSSSSGSTVYSYTQAALIVNGSLTQDGVSFYASTDYPVNNVGKPGDF